MKTETATKKQTLKKLTTELKSLQADLTQANKIEGKDEYIGIKVKKDQARFERVTKKGEEDKAMGKFFIQVDITAKKETVFIPISISSGKKPSGFMYQIEGTAPGAIGTANVESKGEGVTSVTLGTLLYAKILPGKTASFRIHTHIKGKFGKTYKIIINRINYKLALTDARYNQYIKEIVSKSVSFS